jgi:peptide/nickel transport system ATP-binding protein
VSEPLLSIADLRIDYRQGALSVAAVQGVSLTLDLGEILGIVGESGSGKSSIGYALVGHLGRSGRASGDVRFQGVNLLGLDRRGWARLRGRQIGMVYQEPQSALNPAYRVGEQIAEGLRHHLGLSRGEARRAATEWIGRVHLPEPAVIYDRYPHQLSGGQLQRAVIAMAFAMKPRLVILDEPTTGLDVTTQARILELVAELRSATGAAMLYVSHDLGVVADICDRVVVMHRGRIAEEGLATEVLAEPREPYTRRLVASIPDLYRRQTLDFAADPDGDPQGGSAQVRYLPPVPASRREAPTLLDIRGLGKVYRTGGRETVACADVDIDVLAGEAVALIGESGSGKTTVAKCILGLERPSTGTIELGGTPLPPHVHGRARALRRRVQIVFQNPDGSLNGRRTVGQTLQRPLLLHGRARTAADADRLIPEVLGAVGLPASYAARYPDELSGGEKQRVAFARALAPEPDIIVCDEAVSALDVSVQSMVLDLCRRLQEERGLALLFITHDLAVVRQVAERAVVMLQGRVCHVGSVDSLFEADAHPYVRSLIECVPGRRLAERRRTALCAS